MVDCTEFLQLYTQRALVTPDEYLSIKFYNEKNLTGSLSVNKTRACTGEDLKKERQTKRKLNEEKVEYLAYWLQYAKKKK